MATAESPTLMRTLAARRWPGYEAFRIEFEKTAVSLAGSWGGDQVRRGTLTVSKRQYERWSAGQVKTLPHPRQCLVLEALFGRPVAELFSPSRQIDLIDIGVLDRHPTSADVRTDRPREALADLERQVSMAATRALHFAARAEGTSRYADTLPQLAEEVARIAGAYPRMPLATLLGDLIEIQDIAFRLLQDGTARPAQAGELYLLAGMTCGMLGKASHDLGDSHAALTQSRTAYICAENADHAGLRTWVRALQSMIAYWSGQTKDAIQFAELGAADASTVTGSSAVWLASQEARAQAVLGNVDAAQAAIARAADARDHLQADDLDRFGGIMSFPRPRQLYYAADAAVWLPDRHTLAERYAHEAIDAYSEADPDDWAFSDEAGAHADLALAHISGGRIDGAEDAIRPLLALPVDQRINGIVTSARHVHSALGQRPFVASRAAQDLREEIEVFAQTSLSTLPR